ncbi:DUF1389 domain-containing protein [Chlamydia vaughanii]|uniref:DUF1389 domain-containing protein n=1 Tax=Chlamydia vaughanii TaxID=3112552 RepID=UPI0032B2DFDB
MNPTSTTSAAPVIQNNSSPCSLIAAGLRRHALAITGVLLTILALSITTAIAYSLLPPLAVLGAILASIIAGVLLYFALRNYLQPKLPLPNEFLNLIYRTYPQIIFNLCISHKLTFQELCSLTTGLNLNDDEMFTEDLMRKLGKGGIEVVKRECKDYEIPLMESLALANCPLVFIKRLIQLGDSAFPEAENMPPEMYWTSPLGLTDYPHTVFSPTTWLFAQVATADEYDTLVEHAKNHTWEEAKALVSDIQDRVLLKLDTLGLDQLSQEKSVVRESILSDPWLLCLCKHGFNWQQLLLFRTTPVIFSSFILRMGDFRRRLAHTVVSVYDCICEEKAETYDSHVALVTLAEWMRACLEQIGRGAAFDSDYETAKWFSRRLQNPKAAVKSIPIEGMPGALQFPVYRLDRKSGKKE